MYVAMVVGDDCVILRDSLTPLQLLFIIIIIIHYYSLLFIIMLSHCALLLIMHLFTLGYNKHYLSCLF